MYYSVDRIIDFCNEVDETFPSWIRPTPPELMTRLSELVTLDPIHREFLERVGGSFPRWWDHMDLSAQGLIQAYESTKGTLPDGLTLLGISEDDPWYDLVLSKDGRVLLINSYVGESFENVETKGLEHVADTFSALFCTQALYSKQARIRYPYGRHAGHNYVDPYGLGNVSGELLDRGYSLFFPSGLTVRFLRKGRTLVVLSQASGQALSAGIFGEKEDDELVQLLTGLRLQFATWTL